MYTNFSIISHNLMFPHHVTYFDHWADESFAVTATATTTWLDYGE
jgi:hypothetical protein